MTAVDFYTCSTLVNNFGYSRCFETARMLRALEAYPSGKTQITTKDAITLLYCLAASESMTDTPKSLEQLASCKTQRAVPLLKDLEVLFTLDFQLVEVDAIQISQTTGSVMIFYKNGSAESYRPTLDSREVEKFVILRKSFLLAFKTELIQTEFEGKRI